MSIKTYTSKDILRYKYGRNGLFQMKITNNLSSAVFSGTEINGIKTQITQITRFNSNIKILGNSALEGCEKLTAVGFEGELEQIGARCFKDCIRLISAKLDNSVTQIGAECFLNCANIQEISLPTNLICINSRVFANSPKLKYLNFQYFENDISTDTVISYKLTGTEQNSLSGCSSCTDIVFPPSITAVSMIDTRFLAGSSVSSITMLGINQDEILVSDTGKIFGAEHDCEIFTPDYKKTIYIASTDTMTADSSYKKYGNAPIAVSGKKDKMVISKRIYGFTQELFEWCTVPSTQDSSKFPQQECPVIVIFADFLTSVKSRAFLKNVLSDQSVKSWIKKNVKAYMLVMDRSGQGICSDITADFKYYKSYFSRKKAKTDFVTINFIYKKNFSSVTLTEFTVQEFKTAVLKYQSETKFDEFDYTTYANIIAEPNPETAPGTAIDKTGISEFHSTSIEWYKNDTVSTPSSWNIESTPMDMDLIHTPETTYLLTGGYDQNYPSQYPKNIDNLIAYWSDFADTSVKLRDSECRSKFQQAFLNGKKYRYFIFYEFSHGGHQSITIGIEYSTIWDMFTSMTTHQRIFGMFDSCDSGSMIVNSNVNGIAASTKSENILTYLLRKFERREYLMNAMFGLSATKQTPKMILWASTADYHYGWYYPTKDTVFAEAYVKAYKSTTADDTWPTFSEFWPVLKEYGSCNKGQGENECIPQSMVYPKTGTNFQNNKIFI